MELPERKLRKERQNIGMIFQHFNLLMQRTALDNVCFPMEIVGISKKEARKKALEYLKIVGLEEKALSYPSQLSGGQKQRVAIARVLASDPEKGELAELQVSGEINYQKEVERICEQEGHVWKETNADCESGTSDLECERCHKFQVLHW